MRKLKIKFVIAFTCLIMLSIIALALVTVTITGGFFDAFNRTDSDVVGNGWNQSGNVSISGESLSLNDSWAFASHENLLDGGNSSLGNFTMLIYFHHNGDRPFKFGVDMEPSGTLADDKNQLDFYVYPEQQIGIAFSNDLSVVSQRWGGVGGTIRMMVGTNYTMEIAVNGSDIMNRTARLKFWAHNDTKPHTWNLSLDFNATHHTTQAAIDFNTLYLSSIDQANDEVITVYYVSVNFTGETTSEVTVGSIGNFTFNRSLIIQQEIDFNCTSNNELAPYYSNSSNFLMNASTGNFTIELYQNLTGMNHYNLTCGDLYENKTIIISVNYTNNAPNQSVSVTSPAEVTDALTCSFTLGDPDMDTLHNHTIQWWYFGFENSSNYNLTSINAANTSIGDKIACSINVTDNRTSKRIFSDNVTIGDITAPSMENITATPSVTETDDIQISAEVTDAGSGVLTTACIFEMFQDGLATELFNLTSDTKSSDTISRTIGAGSYLTTVPLEFYKIFCSDTSGNTAVNETVRLNITISASGSGTPSPRGGGGGRTTIIQNVTTEIGSICGDGVCGEGETSGNCIEDCPINVDDILFCLFDDPLKTCKENFFATLLLWGLFIVAVYFVIGDTEGKLLRKLKK